MKILRIRVDGLPLYKTPFDVSFCAIQRVQESHLGSVSNLFGNIFTNNAEGFIGINASGKTMALKVISFTYKLLAAVPLNSERFPQILTKEQETIFDVDFYADGQIYHLNSRIVCQTKPDGSNNTMIVAEALYAKKATSKVTKGNLLDFEGLAPVRVRDKADEYLPDDVSIMIAVKKKLPDFSHFADLVMFTDFNLFMPKIRSFPSEVLQLLDPTIEYIRVESINRKYAARVKFYGQDELLLNNPSEFNAYLSSGTIKGIRVFMDAMYILKNGGYLLIDEIENHFNEELVASLLRLFLKERTNPKGSVIIFSTHYPNLLDELDRNDAVFITRNREGLSVDNLNTLLKRNDLKKSEVYQSDYLGGTAPKYSALHALEKYIVEG